MTRTRISDWFPLMAFAILLAIFLYAFVSGHDPKSIPSVLVRKPAPDFNLTDAQGRLHNIQTALSGKVTVINFFASWCLPCRAEHPLLVQIAKRENVRLLGIAYKDNPEAIKKYIAEMGNPYAMILFDARGRAGIDWGITGVPETFIVDANGLIRYHFAGVLSGEQMDDMADIVRQLTENE